MPCTTGSDVAASREGRASLTAAADGADDPRDSTQLAPTDSPRASAKAATTGTSHVWTCDLKADTLRGDAPTGESVP